ncbi:MAG: hypothetical protein SFT68_05295 [Rickettsiaceae bacterium]|nr:hypothetical protein [Rickettsiaceae bacterium]
MLIYLSPLIKSPNDLCDYYTKCRILRRAGNAQKNISSEIYLGYYNSIDSEDVYANNANDNNSISELLLIGTELSSNYREHDEGFEE